MTVYNIYPNHSLMMVEKALVLINTNDCTNYDLLLAQLKKIDGISEAYKVSGIYNICVKIGSWDDVERSKSSQSYTEESKKYSIDTHDGSN